MRRLCKIKFIGELANVVDECQIGATDLQELIKGISVNFPDTKLFFEPSRQICIGVVNGDATKWLTRDEALLQIPDHDVLLVGVDYVGGAEVTIGAFIINTLVGMAVSWAIGRFVTLYLSDKPSTTDAQTDKDSYLLNGPQNSTKSGEAVPLIFGRYRCGSVVISQSLSSERMGTSLRDEWGFVGVTTGSGNLLRNDALGTQLTITSIDVFTNGGGAVTYAVPLTNQALPNGSSLTVAANGSWSITGVTGLVASYKLVYSAGGTTEAGTYTSSSSAMINFSAPYVEEHG